MNSLGFYLDPRNVEEYLFEMGLYPLCNGMVEALNITHIIDEACGPSDPRSLMSTGTLTKAFILNILDQRTPVYQIGESFKYTDTEVLFGSGISYENFTQDRLGDALDALAEIDQRAVFSTVSLRALKMHGIPVNSLHIDTTNCSVQGEYNDGSYGDFEITYCGAPKNNRKDLKAFTIGAAVQQNKLPLLAQALSGNTSDAIWFRDALKEITGFFQGDLFSRPILVLDAAASNTEMFELASDAKAPCVIRLSNRFKIAGEYVARAWENNGWREIGKLAANTEDASSYRITVFSDAKIGPGEWRLVVVHSTALQKSKEKTMAKSLPKKRERIEKQAIKLNKKIFKTEPEARVYADEFIKNNIGLETPFSYQVEIITEVEEKYARPGKPTPDTPKIKITTYRINLILGEIDQLLYDKWLQMESCFVLVSNVPKTRYSAADLLKEYKGQWKIEDMFRFMKQPMIIGPIWLKEPRRIKSLLFIVSLAMLVASYMIHRLHVSLSGIPQSKEEPSEQRYIRDITGSRLIKRPTFKVVRELLIKTKTICYWEDGRWIRKFLRQTPHNLLELMQDIGFSPGLYLEPYRPEFDLWEYKSLRN